MIGLLAGKAELLARIRRHTPRDFAISAIAAHAQHAGDIRATLTAAGTPIALMTS
ncbi:MAG: hypothetical protein JO264_07740 [Acidisphaera sp.]|nr:hypothetical protein [Acidisphaera sp.]